MTALLQVRGNVDPFQADELVEEGDRVRARGQWRHIEGASDTKTRLYGMAGWRSWPSRQVLEVRPLEVQR
jgi:hypothetical protein